MKVAGRYGGDEFVIIFPDYIDETAAYTAKRIIERISTINEILGFEVTVSIGYAIWETGDTAKDLIHKADSAMYQAKEKGKNSISFWTK